MSNVLADVHARHSGVPLQGTRAPSSAPSRRRGGRTLSIPNLVVAVLVLACGVAAADPCVDYHDYVHTTTTFPTPGRGRAVAVEGNRAYVAQGGALLVLDVSAPDSPALLGQVNTPGAPQDVAVAGQVVVVADGGLRVVDVSNPASPVIVGNLDGIGAKRIVTLGDVAFVAADQSVKVVDVSDPAAPNVLTTLPSSPIPISMQDVALGGNLLYALSLDLQIFDVTNPAAPALVGTAGLVGGQRMALVGDAVYIPSGPTKLVDVSNPAAPIVVGNVDLVPWWRLVVSGSHAFAGSLDGALTVLDVTDPLAPFVVGAAPVASGQEGLAVSGDRLFAAGVLASGGGLSVVDIEPAISPPASHVDTPGNAQAVALAGSHAYVADGSSLQVVDLSDRWAPVLVGSAAVEANVVAVDGNRAVVAGGGTTHILDITDPTSPAVLGSLPGDASDLALAGTRAYRADGNLDIIDITNPAMPVLLGSSTTVAQRVEIDGTYAYTARIQSIGMSVLDISGNSPVLVGTSMSGEYCVGFAHEGEYVFGGDPTHGYVWTHDVSTPEAPYLANSLPIRAVSVSTANGLYVTDFWGLLWILPEIPAPQDLLVGFGAVAAPVAWGTSMAVGGGLVVIPAGANGVYVLPDHCESPTAVAETLGRSGLMVQAWPTPGRGTLTLRFALPREGSVRLRVYDVAGRRLRDIVQRWYPAGTHLAGWDGRDDQGRQVGSGVYHVLLTTASGTTSTRAVILR